MESSPYPRDFNPLESPRACRLLGVLILMLILATIAVVARLASRKVKGAKLWWDDRLAVAALIFNFLNDAATIYQIMAGGIGNHTSVIPIENEIKLAKSLPLAQCLYALNMGLIRLSLCMLFLRIFRVDKVFRRLVYGAIAANAAWIIFNIFIVCFRCVPFSKNWNVDGPGHCVSELVVTTTVAATGTAMELFIWSIPIPLVWKLHMSTSRKIALTGVFLLGLFDIAVGIVRVVTVANVSYVDQSWGEEPAVEWILTETSVAIIVACLPICPPIFRKALPVNMRSFHKNSNNSSQHNKKGYYQSREDHFQLVGNLSMGKNTAITKGSLKRSPSNSDVDAISDHNLQDIQDSESGHVHVKQGFSVERQEAAREPWV